MFNFIANKINKNFLPLVYRRKKLYRFEIQSIWTNGDCAVLE